MRPREHAQKQSLFVGEEQAAWALFARAPSVRFAGVDAVGRPVLRTLSAAVLDGRLCFHGTDHGEKLAFLGGEVVASHDDVVAQIPSYWIHPELACPASTYYLSAMVEGKVERVDDLAHKARVLTALMKHFQPEGGYAELRADDKRYRKVLETMMVAELQPTRVTAKHKLGQHRTRAQIERVLTGLWRRGAPGDLRALRLVLEAHPDRPLPEFLRGPAACELCVAPDADDARAVASLLEGQYWTETFTSEQLVAATLGSTAWVVARDREGAVVASARAVTDHARFGYVLDVIVRADQRGRGLGIALMRLLLDHPALRALCTIGLRTRDAQDLYRKLGFAEGEARGSELFLRRQVTPVACARSESRSAWTARAGRTEKT
jgi:ribosomal protein S18 acetylase RimI-like enzyme/nitroimidazol reductase NimA-like FMN-containing flavoprotein (pyridoxamine 5'-phosphate oxidase superfamily)